MQTFLDLKALPPLDFADQGLVTEGTARSWAAFSKDGAYRYALGRHWHDHGAPPNKSRLMVFVMLNPSTAGGLIDDPTIRRCISFAERELLNGILVVNLFGFRSTKPRGLLDTADPIGPQNDRMVRWALNHPDIAIAVAAWGRISLPRVRRLAVMPRQSVLDMPAPHGDVARYPFSCLGLTEVAPFEPRHPLMLRNDAPLVRFQ
jgi:hypothetical protein